MPLTASEERPNITKIVGGDDSMWAIDCEGMLWNFGAHAPHKYRQSWERMSSPDGRVSDFYFHAGYDNEGDRLKGRLRILTRNGTVWELNPWHYIFEQIV